ncbi:MAG: UbiA family prenyltransferase [Cytophagaceae bacterium]
MTRAVIKSVLDFVLYSSIVLSICAAGLTFSTYLILDLIPGFETILLCTIAFSGTFLIYNIPVWLQEEECQEFYGIISFRAIKIIFGILSLLLIFCASLLPSKVLLFLLHVLIIALIYVLTGLRSVRFLNVRKVPFLKIFLLTYAWGATTVFMPVLWHNLNIFSSGVLMLFFERFLIILALAIPFDIRDRQSDEEAGILTIPVILGTERAKDVSLVILTILIVVTVIHYGAGPVLSSRLITISLAVAAISYVHEGLSKKYYLIFIDGIMLVQVAVLWWLMF